MNRNTLARLTLIGLLFVVGQLGPASCIYGQESVEKSGKVLRILSYNIHHGEGVDRKLDLERIAKVILSAKPDLVALQEVDVETNRTEKVDQAKKLAELTRMKYAFGGNIEFGGGKYGNAILSRFPIKAKKNVTLPNYLQGEQRGLLQVEVQPDFLSQPVHFWCTHWDHRRVDNARYASARLCNELLAKSNPDYCFMAGDFNDVKRNRSIKVLAERWNPSNSNALATVPVVKPTRQIDYIWSKKNSKTECVQTLVLPEKVASDHRAILAVYLINE